MIYNPYADTSVYLGTIQLPHVTNISISNEWTQTELPIERGAVINDHRRKRPITGTISGYVTGQIELIPSGAGALLGADATRTALETLANLGLTFVLKWGRRLWPNMSIVGIAEDFSAEQRDDMWPFTLQLAETRVATSTTVAAAPVAPGIADLTASAVDGGVQAGTAVGPDSAAAVSGIVGGGV